MSSSSSVSGATVLLPCVGGENGRLHVTGSSAILRGRRVEVHLFGGGRSLRYMSSSSEPSSISFPCRTTQGIGLQKNGSRSGSAKKEQPCVYFLRREGCKRGPNCRILHNTTTHAQKKLLVLTETWRRNGQSQDDESPETANLLGVPMDIPLLGGSMCV